MKTITNIIQSENPKVPLAIGLSIMCILVLVTIFGNKPKEQTGRGPASASVYLPQ